MDKEMMGLLAAGAVAFLLAFGKDSPVANVLGKIKDTLKKAMPVPIVADVVHQAAPSNNRLPSWISDANDLQQMLLFLANQAANGGKPELKDATLDLMKPYADLQVAVKD